MTKRILTVIALLLILVIPASAETDRNYFTLEVSAPETFSSSVILTFSISESEPAQRMTFGPGSHEVPIAEGEYSIISCVLSDPAQPYILHYPDSFTATPGSTVIITVEEMSAAEQSDYWMANETAIGANGSVDEYDIVPENFPSSEDEPVPEPEEEQGLESTEEEVKEPVYDEGIATYIGPDPDDPDIAEEQVPEAAEEEVPETTAKEVTLALIKRMIVPIMLILAAVAIYIYGSLR